MGSLKSNAIYSEKTLQSFQNKFSHIYRRKTIWELMRMSLAVFGIELAVAALTAFVSPILLELGIQYSLMVLVWGIPPFIGFFLSPLMGSLSDRCPLKMGRRRPFIILFSITNVIGLMMIPFGEILVSDTLSLFSQRVKVTAAVITVVGIVMTDYSSDALQHPCRAYLLDVCRLDDHARGLTTFTVFAGCGGFLGYLLGSIDYEPHRFFGEYFTHKVFSGHVHILYTIIAFMFAICMTIAITTFKEIPLKLVDYFSVEPDLIVEGGIYETEFEDASKLYVKQSSYKSIVDDDIVEKNTAAVVAHERRNRKATDYLKSIVRMPRSLRMLCIVNILCWMAHSSYTQYFTDFIGSQVFAGNPNAPTGSLKRELYEDGVRYGCVCLAVESLACMMYSFVIESLIKRFGLKRVFMGGMLLDSLSLLIMACVQLKWVVLVFSVSCGVFYATLFTVPYILVAHYHSTNVFELDSCGDTIPQKQIRGIGTDVSMIGASSFVSQLTLAVTMSIVTRYINSSTVSIVGGSLFAFCGFVFSSRIMYLDL